MATIRLDPVRQRAGSWPDNTPPSKPTARNALLSKSESSISPFPTNTKDTPLESLPVVNVVDPKLVHYLNKNYSNDLFETTVKRLKVQLSNGSFMACQLLVPAPKTPPPEPVVREDTLITRVVRLGQEKGFFPKNTSELDNLVLIEKITATIEKNKFLQFAVDACLWSTDERVFVSTALWLLFLFKYDSAIDTVEHTRMEASDKSLFLTEVDGLNTLLIASFETNQLGVNPPLTPTFIPQSEKEILQNLIVSFSQSIKFDPQEIGDDSHKMKCAIIQYLSSALAEIRTGKTLSKKTTSLSGRDSETVQFDTIEEKLAKFIEHRIISGAVITMYRLHEKLSGLDKNKLTDEILSEFSMSESDKIGNTQTCLDNDLRSKKREDSENNPFNSVRIIQPLASSEIKAYQLIAEYSNHLYMKEAGFLEHAYKMATFPNQEKRAIAQQLLQQRLFCRLSNIDFCNTTNRYD